MYVPATTLTQPGLLAEAETFIDQQPEKYSMAGGDGLKSAAAASKGRKGGSEGGTREHITVLNASRVAAARTTEGFLECRYAGCHRSVTPGRRKSRATTCGQKNCPKN